MSIAGGLYGGGDKDVLGGGFLIRESWAGFLGAQGWGNCGGEG